MKIQIINGPNLNLLGKREPGIYGAITLDDIRLRCIELAEKAELGLTVEFFQSNAEHELIDMVHRAPDEQVEFVIINPAGFTHTSVALRDALLGVALPFIEVHLSNIHAREPFRHHSYFSDAAVGVICGLGAQGYEFALQAAIRYLSQHQSS